MKVFSIKSTARVFVYKDAINMGASFPKLSSLVAEHFKAKGTELENGDLFLFMNHRKNYLKVIYAHGGGLCLFAKRVEVGHFKAIANGRLSLQELSSLINSPVRGLGLVTKEAA